MILPGLADYRMWIADVDENQVIMRRRTTKSVVGDKERAVLRLRRAYGIQSQLSIMRDNQHERAW